MVAILLLIACGGTGETPAPSSTPGPANSARRTFVHGESTIAVVTAVDIVRVEVQHGPCVQTVRADHDGHLMVLNSPSGSLRAQVVDDELDVRDASFCGEDVDLSGTYSER